MMISAAVRVVLLVVGLVAAVAGAVLARKRDNKKLRYAGFAAIPLGLAITYWSYRHSIDVLLVTDGPTVERKLASSIDEPIAAGAKDELGNTIGDSVWLVNRSSHTVRVEHVQYGGASEPDPPTVFPPNSAGIFYSIDYIGPDHQPPRTQMVSRMIGVDVKEWLTW